MSDEGMMWANLGGMPHINRYILGVKAVRAADNNPDNTMLLAFTEQDLAVTSFAAMVLAIFVPELWKQIEPLQEKLKECSVAQDFLPWINREDDDDV